MSKPKKVVKKSKPVTKPKKKVPAKKRRETVKIPRALNKQIAESVATAGEPGPAHDCGPEWDGFYEWIKPLSPAALVRGILAEKHALNGPGVQEYYEYTQTSDVAQLRADLTKAAKAVHEAGIPYEWPEDVHEYYPEPPPAQTVFQREVEVMRNGDGSVSHLPGVITHHGAPINLAEETDLCKDPGDGELDTLAHIITDLGYAMRAARFIRRRVKEGVALDASPGYLLRDAGRELSKANDALNAIVAMVRRAKEDEPAGDKN